MHARGRTARRLLRVARWVPLRAGGLLPLCRHQFHRRESRGPPALLASNPHAHSTRQDGGQSCPFVLMHEGSHDLDEKRRDQTLDRTQLCEKQD